MFSGDALWFSIAGIFGTAIFGVKTLMLLVGGDSDFGDFDSADGADGMGDGLDADAGDGNVDHGLTNTILELLSVQTLAAFTMGGGWLGLVAFETLKLGTTLSVIAAVAGGIGMVWFVGKLFRLAMKLQQSDNIPIGRAVGEFGRVQVPVPAAGQGTGRVQVVIGGRSREFNAVTETGDRLSIGTRIRVRSVGAGNRLLVEPAAG
ncbi:MAG: NfeD family protein [Planctomycetota bacterium]